MNIITQIVKDIQKGRGEESLRLLGDKEIECKRVSTQCLSLDGILGGGLPVGRIIEIFGTEGSGKTTVSLHILAEVQEIGGIACMIDVENALDIDYAKVIGIDNFLGNCLILSQPDSGEEVFEIALDLMDRKQELAKDKILAIVIDSVAALATREELEGNIGDLKMAPVARLLSQSLRRLKKKVAETNTLLIFINQLRDRIGIVFGNPSSSTGGRALKFYSSVRLELEVGKKLKEKEKLVGQEVRARVVKNKTASPFQQCTFRLIWGKGIDKEYSLLEVAVEKGIIKRQGNWYQFGEVKKNGVTAFVKTLKESAKLRENVLKGIKDA